MDAQDNIRFALIGITTDQFAIINVPLDNNIGLDISISIKDDYSNMGIGLGVTIKFMSLNEAFLVIGVTCSFKIDPSSWSELSNNETGDIILSKDFIQHLIALTLSSARGVLHSKTENTLFNKYFIPLIDLSSFGGKGYTIKNN